jgi:hypothetical protein
MEQMLDDLLTRTLSQADGIVLQRADGEPADVRDAVTAFDPDWAILECPSDFPVEEYVQTFVAKPKFKALALADHGARNLVFIQLGQLSPEELLRLLERIDSEVRTDAVG